MRAFVYTRERVSVRRLQQELEAERPNQGCLGEDESVVVFQGEFALVADPKNATRAQPRKACLR